MMASATLEGAFVWQLLLAVSFFANLGLTILALVNRRQKRDVRFEPEWQPKGNYVLKDELIGIEQRLNTLQGDGDERRRAMYEKIEEVRREVKTDVAGVHERVNDVLEAVAEVRGEIKNLRHK